MRWNLQFWKKKNSPENDEKAVSSENSTGNPETLTVTAAQKTDGKLGNMLGSLYRLVVMADFDRDSYTVISGNPVFDKGELEVSGVYSEQLEKAKKLFPIWEQEHFQRMLDKNLLAAMFLEGKSYVSDLFTVRGRSYEIRAERVPKADPADKGISCCIFVRRVMNMEDDGRSEARKIEEARNQNVTEGDVAAAAIFIGSYEISVKQNLLIGYERRDGVLCRTDETCPMVETIEEMIKEGIIVGESARVYRNFCKPGFLKKQTADGHYTAEVLLKKKGTIEPRWYEEMVFPAGANFRVFRRDINGVKKERDARQKEEEDRKYDKYNYAMLHTVAGLVEYRNTETGPHIENVNELTQIILEDLMEHCPSYGLTSYIVKIYTEASTMHDIGKITIPDAILNKPGRLTEEEREKMMRHTTNGAVIVDQMSARGHEELNRYCKDIVLHHHERYDGNGYPEGLKGEQISIGAQVVGLADAFDALTSKRSYKPAYSLDRALEMIEGGECGVFSRDVLDSLHRCMGKIYELYGIPEKNSGSDETDPEE